MITIGPTSTSWRRSSYSGSAGDNCVELAGVAGGVLVRDSKEPDGAGLAFRRGVFAAFAREVRDGRHDL
ncbi:DUF397 domain-containing protein [Actinomadura parmotrematis]|uniref:DUF397 domain-containing protein n=1 Tax=Actinomadura parmotrematis TaxID=2864039 RepID=A0ABS7G0U9_9ACTN|nr:DUF397 domain-containing protein [Actinomadura parmotrematis]MBW8485273.1 DUF397 domain-containing protein [Actinomadura parmotrematis]